MSFSASLPKAALDQLKGFITLCKAKPEVLHNPDLSFFSDYLLSMGASLPAKPEEPKHRAPMDPPPKAAAKEEEMEVESEESDVELDMTGVIDKPDSENHEMGDADKKEMTDEEMENFDCKRGEAMSAFSEGDWESAIGLFTEAIELNPNSAAMFAKRGACFIKVQKPNACVRDCTRAIELNPDNAGAYKFRGRSHRLLGNFTAAAKDLATACKIDFDEQADEWLKEVQPNAKKLAEHQRKKDRKDQEKQLAEKKERIKKAKEAREAAAKQAAENPQLLAGASLLTADGSAGLLRPDRSLVLLYFSAHWCPPCKQFTPVLRDFYEEAEEQGVEVVFVSWDRSQQEMQAYMRESHGPWLALAPGSPVGARLKEEHRVEGIPALVVVTREGALVTRQGREDVSSLPPRQCVAKWRKA